MKPRKLERSEAEDLFRTRLQNIIAPKHPLVMLAHETDWNFFEAAIEPLYAERGRANAAARCQARGAWCVTHGMRLTSLVAILTFDPTLAGSATLNWSH